MSPVIVYKDAKWIVPCLAELRKATAVDIASFIFDDPEFTETLVQRLRSRVPFSCRIYVDSSTFDARSSRRQAPRLRELKRLGAAVFLCTGYDATASFGPRAHQGIMHLKAIVIDQDVAYSGSANITLGARSNRELTFRFSGTAVADISVAIRSMDASAKPL